MITTHTNDTGLPISVVVPLSQQRNSFFNGYVLPMLQANNPKEIIVNDDAGNAPSKRNAGAKVATQPYLFFCDDDILLPKDYLSTLLQTLTDNPQCGYAYTGYQAIVLSPTHPIGRNYHVASTTFNASALRQYNYISTMSLMRKEFFSGFDESIDRFQDWDLWLTLLEKGVTGICVKTLEFLAFYLDAGITSHKNNPNDSIHKIQIKHKLM